MGRSLGSGMGLSFGDVDRSNPTSLSQVIFRFDSKFLQYVGFSFLHFRPQAGLASSWPTRCNVPWIDVQQQLVVRRPTILRRSPQSRLGADDHFALQAVALVEHETQHVGRAAMAEIPPVEPGDRLVVDHGHADPGLRTPASRSTLRTALRNSRRSNGRWVCSSAISIVISMATADGCFMRNVDRDTSAVHDRSRPPT